ncbi:polymorphic toxin-type HINT domain-containing protein [Micromonospora rubida]|uniref:Polymorphic toxin-type HINT domain-containing protein n=1 Tax=Micromonospora rubida TaxID=2697657 RepID=A0ABW7SCS7_9ACTN
MAAATTATALVASTTPATAAEPKKGSCVDEQPDAGAARRMLAACGRRVEVLSERTEWSQNFLNPDGSRTLEQTVEPTRVRKGKSWAPVDTTLKLTPEGIVPRATVLPMVFSAKGDRPFARLRDGSRELAVSWPGKLPVPVLSGSTATYRDVLPDVDLQVTAQPLGFSEVLVVRTREAAANPKLASLRFGIEAKGLSVGAAAGGGLAARDARGGTVFAAPAPLMWDSWDPEDHTAAAPAPEKREQDASPRAKPTKPAPAAPARAAEVASDRSAVAERAHRAVMPVRVDGDVMTLAPDKAMLADPGTKLPIYIDPSWTGGIAGNAWTSVWSKHKSSSFWQNSSALTNGKVVGSAGAGRTEDCSGCADHILRSMFRMNTSVVAGKHILSAQFRVEQRWSWTCSPKTNAKLWMTGSISSGTTWNKQPTWYSTYTAQSVGNRKYGSAHGCLGTGTIEFNVKSMVEKAAASKWPNLTVGLRAIDEGTKNQWKRFNHASPKLAITYNTDPNAPGDRKSDGKVCATGASRPYVLTTTPILAAKHSDPDHRSGGDQTTTYTYPTAGSPRPHALTATSGARTGTYTYDQAGHTLTRPTDAAGTQTLTWDPEGHAETSTDNAGQTTYLYDADGNRLIRRDPTGKTLYLPGQELRYTTSTATTTCTRYYSYGGSTIASRTAAALSWLSSDNHATAQISVNAGSQQATIRRQLPYGQDRGTGVSWPNDKGFVDGTEDNTGLTHLGAREYDTITGRFISVDPLQDLTDPQQWHGYAYSHNNPTTFSDPSGLIDADCVTVAGGCPDYQPGNEKANRKNKKKSSCWPIRCGAAIIRPNVRILGHVILVPETIDIDRFTELWNDKRAEVIGQAEGWGQTEVLHQEFALAMQVCAIINDEACRKYVQDVLYPGYWQTMMPLPDEDGLALPVGMTALGRAVLPPGATVPTGTGIRPAWQQGSPCSFDGATGVLMADGSTKPIKDIKVGDEVIATDPVTGEQGPRVVTHLWVHEDEMVALTVNGKVLTTTEDHPFWNATDQQWQRADELDPGDLLRTPTGEGKPVDAPATGSPKRGTAYNLSVEGLHTYYVIAGNTPVLVHNTGCAPPNLSPAGAGRSGAFNQAKRDSGIPTSQSPSRTLPNVDRRGNPQPGTIYEFDVPAPGGGTRTVRIRDDSRGHVFPDDPSQNRGPHFNTENGDHYDY